jgi:hypothetical protein
MNQQQKAARAEAIRHLTDLLEHVGARPEDAMVESKIRMFVDDIIEAATPGQSEYADAVEELRKPKA